MTRLVRSVGMVLSILIAGASPCPGAPGAASSLQTEACRLPNLARAARCGALSVAEDPDQPNGRRLVIHFAIVSASSGRPLPDPIVLLMGGPGEQAIAAAAGYAEQFEALLDDRD